MTVPIISLMPSYNSMIRGCPGISDTLPRIECQLRVRSNNGSEFRIAKIEVILKSVETVFPQSHVSYSFTPIGKSKSKPRKNESISYHYKKSFYLANDEKCKATKNKNTQRISKPLIGVDFPLTISLPADINDTNFNSRFGTCVTYLECNLLYYDLEKVGPSFDSVPPELKNFITTVNVERYTNLPLKKLFPAIEKNFYSPDKKLKAKVYVENPCITTDDLLKIKLKVMPNQHSSSTAPEYENSVLFKKKLKVKSVTFQTKEIFQCHSETYESKEYVLDTETKNYNEIITMNGFETANDIHICTKDVLFKEFENTMLEPELLYKLPKQPEGNMTNRNVPTKLLQNKVDAIPFRYHCSISTNGKYYSIGHAIDIKIKIGSGKDFEFSIPITISQWLKSHTKYIQQAIIQEREIASHAKRFYSGYGGLQKHSNGMIEYPTLPPIIYDSREHNNSKNFHIFQLTSGNGKSQLKKLPIID
ncbi:hypothetical protein J7297_02285 [Nakaseomyces glabratus]|nr:hypothetical protein J7297_02285 [Nakaseomyces glabratus]KAH7592184.1 hypothetical protein J7296_02285 [Nakaseomyces glabratus]KAI8396851.1 hypothetical protein J6895_02306 [Nakaseomyces glabratus]KAJ9571166.1 hypothetical protein LTX96_0002191 [Nakaseomyces glabratus]OXB42892.1 hypothetical protein B1J91_H05203g [Nakaseomyces glabratus]